MRYAVWYINSQGKMSCDGVFEVIDPSTYSQNDVNGEWHPVPFYETFPESKPPEGFFMVRVPEYG